MQLNYQRSGKIGNPTVVLMHGLFGSLENLNIIAKALSEAFDVVNIDLRNHGRSFHSDEFNYQAMADDIKRLLNALSIVDCHLVGHSMGGKVAMQFAQQYPELINKLVVLDIAPVAYHSRHDNIIAALKSVATAKVTARVDADNLMQPYIEELGVRQFLLKSLAKNDDGFFAWRFNLSAIAANYGQIISNINENQSCLCDTLFIKGSNSDYILPEHRDKIMKLFPNAKAKIIQGAGHWLHAEKPAAVNRSIIDFIR
ncbi:alpha/beta fold hydrolase [Pseudoalteromonas sp. T1lg65]|uniref:alpha/beta fold hydrolase n=1 Tax=Pseudoalteromonas sp. T1lg65 TaxID=2077101 RepID=UPI003F79D7A1